MSSILLTLRFKSIAAIATLCCVGILPAAADEQDGFQVAAPHYGEVLYWFYQQEHFAALTSLVVSRQFDRLGVHDQEAELLQGGLLLSWGQHEKAGEIFERLLAESTEQSVRDRTWFYLGKVRYQRGYISEAEDAFLSIKGVLPIQLEAERHNLLARIYIDQERFQDAATVLADWQGPEIWMVYARYNLGVALVRMGELDAGAAVLDQLGTMQVSDEETLALRDRANLALGFAYLQADRQTAAQPVLQRVRINGPFSNKALLGAGWAASAEQNYRKALAPWLELSERSLVDSAVQESLLAVPYAFSQLDAEPQAAEYYAHALGIFNSEIQRLDEAMQTASSGELVDVLLEQNPGSGGGWFWQLTNLPDDEQTRYLYFAIADHRFHETLKSYRDMLALLAHMNEWESRLGAYQNMVDTRERAYAERLPAMQSRMAEFDLAQMQSRYAELESRTSSAREERSALALASPEQRNQWQRLEKLEQSDGWSAPDAEDLRAKQRVLKGLLQWDMERDFKLRLWKQEKELRRLAAALEQTGTGFTSVDAAVGTLDGTVEGFAARIDSATQEIQRIKLQLEESLQAHRNFMDGIAVAELGAQQERLISYRSQARFALASIYDRLSAGTDTGFGVGSDE